MFRFLLPAQNPLGFGATDFISLGLGVLLVAVVLARAQLLKSARKLAPRTILCMVLLAALPIVLRMALLPHHPVPVPAVADDFSFLLLGDTLAHFRFANPEHPMRRFFEGVFVMQEPSWSSMNPMGQGLALAFGELVFGIPWAGVVLTVGAFCALCYWMLRAWVSPVWALAGGLLAAIEFGPLSSWMNSYWHSPVSGVAGCLVFGALPRLRQGHRGRDAVLLGLGLALQLLTRPYEFVVLVLIVLLFFVPLRSLVVAGLVVVPALGLVLLQNKQVTGSWTMLPYQLSRYQYGVPASFTFQPNPIPHHTLTVEQQIAYEAHVAVHDNANFRERVPFLRFFFLAPLYLVLPAFLFALREPRFIRVVAAIALMFVADRFYPYFYPHYIAAVACLFVLISVKGLEQLGRLSKEVVTLILSLCFGHFLFWYGIHLGGNENLLIATSANESWDYINYGDPEGRIAVNTQLAQAGGKQLVFVHYSPQHGAREWIQNAADIDGSRVVWAIDLGAAEDEALRHYYPDRHVWFLEADAHPPKLVEGLATP